MTSDEGPSAAGSSPGAVTALRSCLTFLLARGVDRDGSWSLPEGVTGADFVAAAARHRTFPFLARHMTSLALPDTATRHIADVGALLHRASMVQSAELLRMARALESAGLRFLCFKGPCLAVQVFGRTDARGPGDLDVLVHPEDVGRAQQVLTEHGWPALEGYPAPNSGWGYRHMIRNGYEMPLRSNTVNVDLHWWLAPARSALPDFDTLWARRTLVRLGGSDVPSLSLRDAFHHSCSHAAKDDWRWLRSLIDINQLASQPELWARDATDLLLPGDLKSLAVTRAAVGLPATVPVSVLAKITGLERRPIIARALTRQESPAFIDPHPRVPGATWGQTLRRSLRGSKRPEDVRRVVAMLLLPPPAFASVTADSASRAIPRAAVARVIRVVEIIRHGRERRA